MPVVVEDLFMDLVFVFDHLLDVRVQVNAEGQESFDVANGHFLLKRQKCFKLKINCNFLSRINFKFLNNHSKVQWED